MAVKRKVSQDAVHAMSKRYRSSLATDDNEFDTDSDGSSDYQANYTDNGKRRADSEARRQWNYICPVASCAQRFNRPCRLEAHMRSHNKQRPFACSAVGCDKTFPRKDHLQRHVKNAHSDPELERTYACDWAGCEKSFTSNGRLQRHRDVHASKFYCTEFPPCNEHFRKAKALEAHIKSQHLEVKPYPCTFVDPDIGSKCTSGFQTEGALRRHRIRVHGDDQEEGHFCMLCLPPNAGAYTDDPTQESRPVSFTTLQELAAHTKEHHPPECTECRQKFKNASTLRSHLDTVHTDPAEQPQFACPRPDCDSVFNRKHNLTVHIQTVHEQQFRFFCNPDALRQSKHDDLRAWDGHNACGAAFKAKSSLDQHVRTHHLGLGNRKQRRRAAKSKLPSHPASLLTLLTGVGYEQGRDIPCLVPACAFRFSRDHDLRRHLCAAHNLSAPDAEDLLLQRNAQTGGQFWIGGLDVSCTTATASASTSASTSTDPSLPQTPIPYAPPPLSADATTPALSKLPYYPGAPDVFDAQLAHLSLLAGDAQAEQEEEETAHLDMALEWPCAWEPPPPTLWDTLAPIDHFNHSSSTAS